MSATVILPTSAYRNYVRATPGLIDPEMTRSVRVNWEVSGLLTEAIPEGFPWKVAEGTSAQTEVRSDRYERLRATLPPDVRGLANGVQFMNANQASAAGIMLGISNQGFVPVKTYAQRRENGKIRLTVVLMDLDKALHHPVASLIDTPQAEFWKHRDITAFSRSASVVWNRVFGYNNPVWDGETLNPRERSLDLTFLGRQERRGKCQPRYVVRVHDHKVCLDRVEETFDAEWQRAGEVADKTLRDLTKTFGL